MTKSWTECTLGDLVSENAGIKTGPFGTALSASEYTKIGVPVISVGEIGYGVFRLRAETPRVGAPTTSRLSEYLLQKGDIVFGRKGAVDRSAWVSDDQIGWFLGSDGIRIRPRSAVSSRFLSYQLRAVSVRDWLLQHAGGSTLLSLNQSTLARVPILLPPLPEQQAIAEVLGALDDKIAANTALAQRAEELAASTYDTIAAGWPQASMSNILNPVLGGTPPRKRIDYWRNGTDLWVSARDITSAPMRVVVDTTEKITDLAVENTKAKPLPVGSVILTARGTVGEVGRLNKPASFNQSCYGFEPDVVPPALLYFSVLRACERAKAISHGSVFDTITKSTFGHLTMAWDPDSAAQAETLLSPLLASVASAVEENHTLAVTRDTLLPQLMSGKLRVRDAEVAASDAGA
jgi:type I restriction enzyme S subunit